MTASPKWYRAKRPLISRIIDTLLKKEQMLYQYLYPYADQDETAEDSDFFTCDLTQTFAEHHSCYGHDGSNDTDYNTRIQNRDV